MAGIAFDLYDVTGDYEMAATYRNVTGSPVSGVVVTGFAEFAGVFRITFDDTTHVSVTLPNSADTSHPLLQSGSLAVTCDGVTENENVIPGVGIVFASGCTAGDVADVGLGTALNSNSEWLRTFAFGPQVPDTVSSARYFKVRNESGETLYSYKLYATNAVRVENDEARDRPFAAVWQQGEGSPTADGDTDGVAVLFTVTGDDGGVPLVELRIGGVLQTVCENADGTGTTTTLRAEATSAYRFQDGSKYDSVFFQVSPDVQDGDTATIFVSPGGDCVEIALDGGSWTAGTTGIDLPDMADAATQVIKIRSVVPSSADDSMNLRSFSLRATLPYSGM